MCAAPTPTLPRCAEEGADRLRWPHIYWIRRDFPPGNRMQQPVPDRIAFDDVVIDFAPPARRKVLQIISTLVLTAVLLPVVFASFRVVSLLFEFDQRSDALNLPMWIAQGVVPVTLLLIVVMSLARVFVQVTTESAAADELGRR